jgi:transcriptional regulator with XRE-family HTH domain
VPAKPLTADQHDDARRLRDALSRAKQERGLTQAELATLCGWDSQSTVSQYANGRIPLNIDALGSMCIHLHVPMADISPLLAKRLAQLVQTLPKEQRSFPRNSWPFERLTRAQWDRLSDAQRRSIEQYVAFVFGTGSDGS